MKKTLKVLARVLLGALTGLFTFVIAACYGAAYSYQRGGRVVDARSQQGLAGARVECNANGATQAQAVTGPDGSFNLDPDSTCREVVVQDPNGGYVVQTVALPPDGHVYVELSPNQ